MTRGLTPPSVTGDLSTIKKRVTDLERKLGDLDRKNPYLGIPFSLAGILFVSESPPWTSPVELRVSTLVVLLGTAGTTTTTITAKVNGTTVATVSLAAGEKLRKATISTLLAPDQDILTIACTVAGSGAKDLDVIVRVV